MDTHYRPGVGAPGEPLLSVVEPHESAIRLAQFCRETGLSPDRVCISSTCTIPIPLYAADAGDRRWQGVNVDSLWHPLFWLPDHLALRRMVQFEGGDPVVEPDDLWMARVSLELTLSGVFQDETGEWLDVLAMAGINLNDTHNKDRVVRWLSGAPDEVLDRLDLSTVVMAMDDDIAFQSALEALTILRPVAACEHARSLLDNVNDLLENFTGLHSDEMQAACLTIASFAQTSFDALTEPGLSFWDTPIADHQLWLNQAKSELSSLVERFTPNVEELKQLAQDIDNLQFPSEDVWGDGELQWS